jgi:hypothetical protein
MWRLSSSGRQQVRVLKTLSRAFVAFTLGGLSLVLTSCLVVTGADVCRGRTCAGGFVCNPNTGLCEPPVNQTPTACARDSECGGLKPRCDTTAKACVECLANSDCPGGTCSQNACQRLPDSCSTEGTAIDLGQGGVELTGDTSLGNADATLACALPAGSSKDLVYAFSIPARKRLVAHAQAASGSGLLPVLGLRSVCDSSAAADQLGCAEPSVGTSESTLVVDPVLPGTVHLWIDGEAGTEGAFVLQVHLEDTIAGESCAAPIYLALNKPTLSLMGDTSTMADDAAGTCGGSGGNDALYALQLAAPKRVSFEATTSTAGFNPVLYLRTACDDATAARQLACVGGATGVASKVDLPRLEAGTYFLYVDGQSGKAGSYVLKMETKDPVPPPTNDTCASAEVLTVPASGVGTIDRQSDTSLARGDALGCNATGNDIVYTFTTGAAVGLEVKVTPFSGSPLKPVVYVRAAGSCTSDADVDQVACATATSAGAVTTLALPHLPAGSWSIFIDGANNTAGPFDVRFDFKLPAPPPANDTCSMPQSVALSGAPITVYGTTWGATDQHSGCELPLGSYSPDVVYSLVINQKQSLGIDLRAEPGSNLKPVLTLMQPATCSSTSPSDIKGCGYGDPQYPDRMVATLPSIDPGVYPIWIEGDDGTQGAFSLKLVPGPALTVAPVNDACLGAIALTQGVSVTGDTRAATNNSMGTTCGLPYGANGEEAEDVVYRITLASAQTVNLSVTPDATEGQLFRPLVYLEGPGTSACNGGGANKGCNIAQSYGGSATLSVPNLAAGTYFVWVDGAGLSSGKFTIRWQ